MTHHSLRLKKSLGQHFLRDENISRNIVQSLHNQPLHQLLEVGPGAGALTKYLLQWEGIEFKAIELDKEKVEFLLAQYPGIRGKLIQDDFLRAEVPFEGPFTVVGNFPYNISTQILFKMIDWKDQVECVVGMFQKEVALRIAAKEGNKTYGVLSVLVQAFFAVEFLFEVPEQAFMPPPKVKSAVIRLVPRKKSLTYTNEVQFALLVKTAFNQRRKTLRNAVRGLFEPDILADPQFNKRAEQLSLDDFAALTHLMRSTSTAKGQPI